MNKIKGLLPGHIYQFKNASPTSETQLKNILLFLKWKRQSIPHNFSYCDKDGKLQRELTLKENIYLEAIPNSLNSSKDHQLQQMIKKYQSTPINHLFEMIVNWDRYPDEIDSKSQKATSLIKTFIQKKSLIILEDPLAHIPSDQYDLVIGNLMYQVQQFKKTVIIYNKQEVSALAQLYTQTVEFKCNVGFTEKTTEVNIIPFEKSKTVTPLSPLELETDLQEENPDKKSA